MASTLISNSLSELFLPLPLVMMRILVKGLASRCRCCALGCNDRSVVAVLAQARSQAIRIKAPAVGDEQPRLAHREVHARADHAARPLNHGAHVALARLASHALDSEEHRALGPVEPGGHRPAAATVKQRLGQEGG